MIMKRTRSVIFTAIITLLAFGARIYTSCNKDRCSNVTCQNGGACVNGFCSCTYGYEGDHCEIQVKTMIEYWNHGFTDITLTLNNQAYTVPAGRSKGFKGGYGDTLKGNAFTQGPYGVQVIWDSLVTLFPVKGTYIVDLNIPSKYFFVSVINDSASGPIRYIYVNKDNEYGPQGVVNLPYPYLVYGSSIGLGYFHAVANSSVYIRSAANNGEWYFSRLDSTLNLPMTENQYATLIAH